MIKIQKIKLFLFIMLFFSSGIYAQSYYFKRAGAIGAGIKYNQLGFVATVYEKHQNNFHYRFLHGFVSDISTCEIVGAGLVLPVFSNKRKGVLKLNSTLSLNYSTFLTGKKYLISIPGKFGLQYNDKTNLLSFELGYGLNLYSLENKITAPRNLQLEQINHGIYFETSLNIYQIDFEAKDYNMASAANSFNISDVYFKLANKINHLKDKLKKKRRARKSLDIPILEFRNVKFSDGNNNKKIDSKETAYIYFILRNLGSGKTGEIVLKLKNKHGVDGLHYTKEKTFSSIRPNKSKNIKFKLIADETLPNDMAVFEIEAKYAKGKRNKVTLKVPTHKVIGNTIQLGNLSDVDQNIPKTLKKNNNTYALIIGNEDYSPHQTNLSKENNAPYAANDAEIFYRYLNETLGVPEKNITLLKNATAGEMKQNLKKMEKLKNLVSDPAQIIFYYAGHGLPD